MNSFTYIFNKLLPAHLFVLIVSIIFSYAAMATDYYATPNGAGNQNGSGWENAIPGTKIENFINSVMTGGDRLFLDDNSGYFEGLQITITSGGINKANPIVIEGVDLGDGYPLFKGAGRSDGVFIYLSASVSYLTIKNLIVEDYKYVVESEEAINAPNEYITIDGLDINNVTDGLYLRDFRNSTIKNCKVTYHTKRGVRLRTGCRNLEIIDCFTDHNMEDYGNFPSNQFPVGFEVGEGRYDTDSLDQNNITFIRCEARNCVDDDQSYWNGDGFLVNDKHYDIRFYDCLAYGNADGGWDDKGIGTYYENCIAVGNGRNFRNWHSGTYVNCLAANPSKYAEGASGGNDNWWFDGQWGDAVVDLFNCTSHNGSISSSENYVKINYAENCIFSNSIDDARVDKGVGNVFTEETDPNYIASSVDYEGHPRDAYNSQKYGPEKGYWFTTGEKPVIDEVNATPTIGDTPLEVQFEVIANDPDGDDAKLQYCWLLNCGKISNEKDFTYTFHVPGEYQVIVTIRDEDFLSVTDTVPINVTGNYPPEANFVAPINQAFFFVNEPINLEVNATDQDGSIDSVVFYIGNTYLATDTAVPFEYVVPGLASGNYSLKAMVYDNDQATGNSFVDIEVIVPIALTEVSWNGFVDLSWMNKMNGNVAGFGDLAGYNIYRSTVSGTDYVKINNSVIDTSAFTDSTVNNGFTYFYVVTAEDTDGMESASSNEVAAMPQSTFIHLPVSEDAYVRADDFQNENYGNEPEIVIKNVGTKKWTRVGIVKLDLSPLSSVETARLRLNTKAFNEPCLIRCYGVNDDSWNEKEVTWNNLPETGYIIDSAFVFESTSWIEFNITDAVQAELAANDTLSLILTNRDYDNGYVVFSKDHDSTDLHPRLTVLTSDPLTWTIKAESGSGGVIEPGGIVKITDGTDQQFIITPYEGYEVADVLVDGIPVGSVSVYDFTNVTGHHTIEVVFQLITTTLKNELSDPLNIFPNPATSEFRVTGTNIIQRIEIYSANGKYLKTLQTRDQSVIISTSELNGPGVYILKAYTEENIEVKRLIIQP